MNPWKQAREAERRAAVAEDRAAFLEQQLRWMQDRVLESRNDEQRSLKVLANYTAQVAFGGRPFPEVETIPPAPDSSGYIEQIQEQMSGGRSAREEAISQFKREEMQRYQASVTE